MEDTLGVGRVFSDDWLISVLILVLMEDTLGVPCSMIERTSSLVLILVLMEDTLGGVRGVKALFQAGGE